MNYQVISFVYCIIYTSITINLINCNRYLTSKVTIVTQKLLYQMHSYLPKFYYGIHMCHSQLFHHFSIGTPFWTVASFHSIFHILFC